MNLYECDRCAFKRADPADDCPRCWAEFQEFERRTAFNGQFPESPETDARLLPGPRF